MSDHSQLIEAIRAELLGDQRTLNRIRKRGDLASEEKAILKARELKKLGKFKEAAEYLSGIEAWTDPALIYEGELLRGYFYYSLGYLQKAITSYERALWCSLKHNNFTNKFYVHYNLSCFYSAAGLMDLALYHLEEAKPLAEGPVQKSDLLRSQATAEAWLGQPAKALEILNEAAQYLPEMDTPTQNAFKFVQVNIYFLNAKSAEALQILDELKRVRNISTRARAHFEWILLSHLVSGTHKELLPPAPEAIRDNRMLHNQYQVIRCLQSGDTRQADEIWDRLVAEAPCQFAPHFKPANRVAEKDLAFEFIRRQFEVEKTSHLLEDREVEKLSKKLRSLYKELAQSPTPLKKELLIERVWKVPYSQDLDSRFYKALERLKKQSGVNIIHKNSGYWVS